VVIAIVAGVAITRGEDSSNSVSTGNRAPACEAMAALGAAAATSVDSAALRTVFDGVFDAEAEQTGDALGWDVARLRKDVGDEAFSAAKALRLMEDADCDEATVGAVEGAMDASAAVTTIFVEQTDPTTTTPSTSTVPLTLPLPPSTTAAPATTAVTGATAPSTATPGAYLAIDTGTGPVAPEVATAATKVLGLTGSSAEIFQRFSAPDGVTILTNGQLAGFEVSWSAGRTLYHSVRTRYLIAGTDATATRDLLVTALATDGDDVTTGEQTTDERTVQYASVGSNFDISVASIDGTTLIVLLEEVGFREGKLPPVPVEMAANPALIAPLASALANGTLETWLYQIGLRSYANPDDPGRLSVYIRIKAPAEVTDDDQWMTTLCAATGYEAPVITSSYVTCKEPEGYSQWQSFVSDLGDGTPPTVSATITLQGA